MIRVESRSFTGIAVAAMAALRLAHINLLWSDEDYHLAAALQLLHGRLPYRDFWFDKPPLAALFYCLTGGESGWPLRLLDFAFVLTCCWFAYKLARAWWGEREGHIAALLLAFFTTFYLTPATVPFAVDALLLLPHLAAIYFAKQSRPLHSGVCCALGLLTNVKAVFVAATCAIWLTSDLPLFVAGIALPLALATVAAAAFRLLPDFYNQVWRWGLMYAAGNAEPDAFVTGVRRCADWLGFHAALLAAVFAVIRKDDRFKLTVWFVFSAATLLLGNHFAPRYFFQLLPVLVVAAARGIVIATDLYGRMAQVVLAILLLIPVIRFAPRYLELTLDNIEGRQTTWTDAALDLDSQQVADFINTHKHASDSLFVWGYRPDVYVYTRLIAPGKFWDSQPLDGVPADRHLQSSVPSPGVAALEYREQMVRTKPTFIVDGLGKLNPALKPDHFPSIAAWLRGYRVVKETRYSRIYQRFND
jgi:hypothetical protein